MQYNPLPNDNKDNNDNQQSKAKRPAKKTRGANRAATQTRFNLSIAPGLLELVDEVAKKEFTTRSDVIRTALLWYLRPVGGEQFNYQSEQEALFELLRRRKARAASYYERQKLKKLLEEEQSV